MVRMNDMVRANVDSDSGKFMKGDYLYVGSTYEDDFIRAYNLTNPDLTKNYQLAGLSAEEYKICSPLEAIPEVCKAGDLVIAMHDCPFLDFKSGDVLMIEKTIHVFELGSRGDCFVKNMSRQCSGSAVALAFDYKSRNFTPEEQVKIDEISKGAV